MLLQVRMRQTKRDSQGGARPNEINAQSVNRPLVSGPPAPPETDKKNSVTNSRKLNKNEEQAGFKN